MIIERGFQADGRNKLERFIIRVTDGTQDIAFYKFQVNPSNYKETIPQRTTTYKTRSASVVEDYGSDLRQIQFSGTTGFKVDSNGHNGAHRLARLKAIIEEYSLSGQRVDDVDQDFMEMYFYNMTDGGSYVVHLAPEGFVINRSEDQPLLYNYQINLTVLRKANQPNIREVDGSAIGNTFYETTSKALNPNSNSANYHRAVQQIERQLDSTGGIIVD